MSRGKFLLRRLAMLLASLLVASFVIFGSLYLAYRFTDEQRAAAGTS